MSPAGGGSTAYCKISSNGGGQEKINNRSPPPLEIFYNQLLSVPRQRRDIELFLLRMA